MEQEPTAVTTEMAAEKMCRRESAMSEILDWTSQSSKHRECFICMLSSNLKICSFHFNGCVKNYKETFLKLLVLLGMCSSEYIN